MKDNETSLIKELITEQEKTKRQAIEAAKTVLLSLIEYEKRNQEFEVLRFVKGKEENNENTSECESSEDVSGLQEKALVTESSED